MRIYFEITRWSEVIVRWLQLDHQENPSASGLLSGPTATKHATATIVPISVGQERKKGQTKVQFH